MRLREMRPLAQALVPHAAVPLSGDLATLGPAERQRRLGQPLGVAPVQVSAPLAAEMWEAAGNRPVDGVLLLDPLALQAILQATGPIEVDGRTMSRDNVVEELLLKQYLRVPDERPEEHQDELGVVAPAAIAALDRGEWSTAQLADGLNGAVRGRHLMIWSATPHQQDAWHATEADGSLRPDSLMVSVLNRGPQQARSPYLRVQADLELRPEEGHGSAVLRFTLRNEAPEGAPGLVVGLQPGSEGNEGEPAPGPPRWWWPGRGADRGGPIHTALRSPFAAGGAQLLGPPSAEWTFRGATWVNDRARMVAW